MNPRMRSYSFTVVAFLVALCAIALTATRADDKAAASTGEPKTGADVMERSSAATGDNAARQKIKNRVMTGTLQLPAQNINGSLSLTMLAPNKSLMVTDIPGIGKIERGTDGQTMWERNPMTGLRIIEGDEKEQSMRQTLENEGDWKKQFTKADLAGTADVDGKKAYKVITTDKNGGTATFYCDAQTYLPLKMEMNFKSQMGEMDVVAKMDEWKDVDGLKLPTKMTQEMMGMQQIIKFDNIEQNTQVDEKQFDLPDDVKQLKQKLDKQGGAGGASKATTKPAPK